jgi:hypothetical protein
MRTAVAALATGLALVVTVTARQPPDVPRFSTGTAAVAVDVVVRDSQGRPAAGLSVADFQVFEDGRPQVVTTFDAVEAVRAGKAASEAREVAAPGIESRRIAVGGVAALVFEELGADGRRLATKAPRRIRPGTARSGSCG